MKQLVLTEREISDADPTRCAPSCQHVIGWWCRLYEESCMGDPHDSIPWQVRCPSCLAAPVMDGMTLDALRKATAKP